MRGVYTLPSPKDISSTNSSTPGVTTTPPNPYYQNNNITNTRRKFTEFTELNKEIKNTDLGRNGLNN